MSQTKIDSLMEAVTNTAIGYSIGVAANAVILPLVLGIEMTIGENAIIAAGFTVISISRSYILRRLFNDRSLWEAIKASLREHGDDPLTRWNR